MRVVGIDPAPKKGLSVFDGQDHHIPLKKTRSYINDLQNERNILVCWDSPLTGPPLAAIEGREADGSAFSKRPIESFFSRKETGFKTPKGISVLGYPGCPHWALSRSLTGLPRTGPYDKGTIPFHLFADPEAKPLQGRHIVEVHPALALWLWCRGSLPVDQKWTYKQDEQIRSELWLQVLKLSTAPEVFPESLDAPNSDDILDARVAYALGEIWLKHSDLVILLGNLESGTFLVPNAKGLEQKFRLFIGRMAYSTVC